MKEHVFQTSRTARYFTLGSLTDATELWFVCHGYGQLAARFLERFQPLESDGRCIIAPEALSRFYLTDRPGERRIGASWMTREDRLHEIDDYVRYLDALYAKITPRDARVTVLGFSQGSATAFRWLALGASRIDRCIVWGGEVPPDLDLARVGARLKGTRLTFVYGTRDAFFTPKIVAATEARLKAYDMRYDLVSFEGGHEIHEATLRSLI